MFLLITLASTTLISSSNLVSVLDCNTTFMSLEAVVEIDEKQGLVV